MGVKFLTQCGRFCDFFLRDRGIERSRHISSIAGLAQELTGVQHSTVPSLIRRSLQIQNRFAAEILLRHCAWLGRRRNLGTFPVPLCTLHAPRSKILRNFPPTAMRLAIVY